MPPPTPLFRNSEVPAWWGFTLNIWQFYNINFMLIWRICACFQWNVCFVVFVRLWNLELMMHSGQLLHSGIFFSNSTKVFVMTHFFTNGFETRTCTSFPNSLKCTTHSNVVLRLGLVRLRSPMEGVGEGGHNQGVILAKIAIFFS